MIDLIVWSRKRPAQLFLLLESIERFATGIFNTWVIFKRDHEYVKTYFKVQDAFPNIHWVPETQTFQGHTKWILGEIGEHICFSTDDEVLFRPINWPILKHHLPKFESEVFSLRLGYNTIEQDIHHGTRQPPLNIHKVHDEGVLEWQIGHYQPDMNYGYFGSLDMNIYKTSLIKRLVEEFEWNNTNTLEGGLSRFRHECNTMKSFSHSVAVNLPINNLSQFTIAGQHFPASPEEIDDQFHNGYKIDLDNITKTPIIGCHQEILLNWIKNE